MHRMRLRNDIWLQLIYQDETRFGSMISGRLEQDLRHRLDPVIAPLVARQWRDIDHFAACRATHEAAAALFAGAHLLKTDLLFPDPAQVWPVALAVQTLNAELGQVALHPALISELADWISDWQDGVSRPMTKPARALFDALTAMGALTNTPAPAALDHPGITVVGHACVSFVSEQRRVLIDPFLPAHDAQARYRPLGISQLAPDLVLITHSHPDHFDPGTLLRLGADCEIIVPVVRRESALSIDMAMRLRQLGFRRVRSMAWQETQTHGDLTIRALPFFGEQPGDGDRHHPEVRNCGNLYTVQSAELRVAFTVDAGRDAAGDVRDVAFADHARNGPVDVLFTGCRAWLLYPVQLLRSSVRRYALFIPPDQWTRRHQLMLGMDGALDVAEAWGARQCVPYAEGGAPWYWSRGLGPDLGQLGSSNSHFDPPPEALVAAARRRSSWGTTDIASPVCVQVIRPGHRLSSRRPFDSATSASSFVAGFPATPAQAWPYPHVDSQAFAPAGDAEEVALARKKALLRILAGEYIRQHALRVTPAEVQRLTDHVRTVAGLTRREDMLAWLARTNLSIDQFTTMMHEWAGCNQLEALFANDIDHRVAAQLALHAMRNAGTHQEPA